MSMSQKEKAEAIKKQLVVINQLLKKPENKLCADCKRTSPTWASVNLGVFVCINCSGCHREIGVHITKIRSTNLDVWPKEVLNNFKIINNKIANKYWECKLKKFNFKSLHSDNYKLVQFIRDKYENKKWVDPKKKDDPMSLIIKGKIKKYKKLYCEDEDEEEAELEEDEEVTKKSKKKRKVEEENSDEDNKKKRKKTKKLKAMKKMRMIAIMIKKRKRKKMKRKKRMKKIKRMTLKIKTKMVMRKILKKYKKKKVKNLKVNHLTHKGLPNKLIIYF
jgi:hypothetical protein